MTDKNQWMHHTIQTDCSEESKKTKIVTTTVNRWDKEGEEKAYNVTKVRGK